MSDAELVAALDSPSHIRTLTAQRTLLRRGVTPVMSTALLELAKNLDKDLRTRVAAVYAVSQRQIEPCASEELIQKLVSLEEDDAIAPYLYRAIGDLAI